MILKRITICFVAFCMTIGLIFSGNVNVEAKTSSAKLKKVLRQYTNEKIIDFQYGDFNGDKKFEAFALVGDRRTQFEKNDCCDGTIWFINSKKAVRLRYADNFGKLNKKFSKIYKFGKTKCIVFQEMYTTCYISYVWTVKGSKAKAEKISGKIDGISKSKYGWLEGIDSTYDGCYSGGYYNVHTWKPYYFYYNNGIKEYGGKKISKKALIRKYKGAKKYIKGKKILDIYYRSNGIININYKKYKEGNTSFYNITLRVKGKKVKKYASDWGRYLKAAVPAIAKYPKKF